MKKCLILTICSALVFAGQVMGQSVVVDSLELSSNVAFGPEAMIAGKVSGVYVSQTQGGIASLLNTHIRGINSGSGSSNPIWIVDGIMLDNNLGQQPSAFWQKYYYDYSFDGQLSTLQELDLSDIESIEVLKNTSATALYGDRGANGVILVKTKKPTDKSGIIEVRANAGVNLPGVSNDYLKAGLAQSYQVAFNQARNMNDLRVTGYYRDFKGTAPNEAFRAGGIRAKFESYGHKVVKFGFNFGALVGNQAETSMGAVYGIPSATLSFRGLSALEDCLNDPQGWIDGFSDKTTSFRSSDEFHVTITPVRNLDWTTSASVDYQGRRRLLWYDDTTAMGKEFERSAAVTSMSLCYMGANTRLKYGLYFAANHRLDIEAGAEYFFRQSLNNTMNGNTIFTPSMGAKGFVFRESLDESSAYRCSYSNYAFFGSIAYDWKQNIGVRASFRTDRNARYDDGMVYYPSGEIYWDIQNTFFPGAHAVSDLKVNVGYGIAGKSDYAPYAMTSWFAPSGYPYVTRDAEVFFDDWRRLRTKEFNASIKLGFIDHRLKFQFGYYDRDTDDHFVMYQNAKENTAKHLWIPCERLVAYEQNYSVLNKGYEMDLDAAIIRRSAVSWSLNLATTYGTTLLDENKLRCAPSVYGGLGTTLRVYDFTLDVQTEGAAGFELCNMNKMLKDKAMETDSEEYYEKADYLRLSRVSLKYDIPLRSKAVSKMYVSVSGANLATLTDYSDWNPCVSTYGATNLKNGYDYGAMALPRTLMLGFGINF